MVGSPNHVRFVYDGDDYAAVTGPAGSDVSSVFVDYFGSQGLARADPVQRPIRLRARSSPRHPSGWSLHRRRGHEDRGAGPIWRDRGGQFDPCYHPACDTFDNVSLDVLDVNADAWPAATFAYSQSTATVDAKGQCHRRPGGFTCEAGPRLT